MKTSRVVLVLAGILILTSTSAFAYNPIKDWPVNGRAGQTYHFSWRLDAGAPYVANANAAHRYWNGRCWAPDLDIVMVNPEGQVYRFTRYGDEMVQFRARCSGRYHFYVKQLYGDGRFVFSLAYNGLPLYPGAPGP
jgi:hypothetical protein